ncbi:hypothetical protein Ecwhy1_527 [Escherichia phage Ecwhy_1]|uniref:hypothetical protein n=1 Tax=Escherichia coli TaxID=562 RepID=UPI001017B2EF|nr:hypothetical protein [Escherichia coli]QAY00800.1 hypothetical protein Ecwhy1_527 [Escherichia phage Ecwhy_1]VVY14218.1 Uncharacterised protein [Escherichia coli]
MLPFARMVKYGNIKVKSTIQKVILGGGGQCVVTLLSDGRVYGRGYNTTHGLGTGTTTFVSDWVLMGDNIVDIHSNGVTGTFLITKENRILYSGFATPINGTTSHYTRFTDLTSTVFAAVDVSNIKTITGNGNVTMVLLNDGSLYGSGANIGVIGNGSNVALSTQTYVTNDVRDVKTYPSMNTITKNNNQILASGILYQGVNGTNSSINTSSYTLLYTLPSSDCFQFAFDTYTFGYVDPSTNTSYIRGIPINGSLGNGVTNNTAVTTWVTKVWNTPIDSSIPNKSYTTNHVSLFNDGNLWTTGASSVGYSNGTNSTTANTWTSSSNLPFNTNNITDYAFGGSITVVVIDYRTMYILANNAIAGTATTTYKFEPYNSPPV